jgi:copper resistance protein B
MKKMTLSLFALYAMAGGMDGDILRGVLVFDQLEYQKYENAKAWDIYGYVGYDRDKIYFYSEGARVKSENESENELVYSRAFAPFWDWQVGIAYDKAENSKTWGEIAISGLAPYFFETRVALLIGEGNVGVRTTLEYEALLTQKLILTPSVEADLYAADDKEMEKGRGLSNITAGFRLRYEIKREFAPYVGVEWSKNFGKTAAYAPLEECYFVMGVRIWF